MLREWTLNEAMRMPARNDNRFNYWWFLIPFAIAALLGCAGILAGELLMPYNAGGMAGRLAAYRYLGTMTVCWLCIAIWAWCKLQTRHFNASASPSPRQHETGTP